ncbi:uncharacterized protein LOC143336289 [Chaetodon auriga]|uniref:uncharacterized protein LOC143336289 n=1 Tax=Chaetodon auriga TaxID=39042 RepID=UPI00403288A1
MGPNRPCPLSHKPLLYSVLTSSNPPLASRATPGQAEAQPIQQSASPHKQPGAVLMANAASGSNGYSSVSKILSTHHPGTSQSSAVSFGQSQRMTHRPPGFTKFQYKLLLMEMEAVNEGLSRTQLTPDRLSVALSVLLTKQMQPSQVLKVPQYVKYKAEGPECGQDFCRLGCVCSSLQHLNRGPLHCRRPECMFGCSCFKPMTNMEHVVQPRPGSHANKLWNRSIDDPDPLFSPRAAPLCLVPVKAVKCSSASRPTQMKSSQIREEDKSAVYRYFESMMTCARVRAFNSEPPPEVTMEPKIPDTSTPNTTAKPRQRTTDSPKMYHRTIMTLKKTAGQTSQGSTSGETEARKQIEIQSACQWNKDRKKVLETLCRRMNQNKLSRRFCIGPYRIRPVAKIFMKKPSGSIVTYRLHISKPSEASDDDEDESDDSDEETHADKSLDGDGDAEEEGGQMEEPEMRFGVTPFLSGVLPAGKLRARTKPVGCQASGLIQVNGKSYNQARLLLGNVGCLHPANRLAAYVTGRLHAPADIPHKTSEKSDPTNKTSTLGALLAMAAGTVVPPIITAKKTTELKIPAQPPVQLSKPDSWRKASITTPQHSQKPLTINPFHAFVPGQRSSVNPFQHSSMSSPVSLTVSPSLKTPSFLGKSGTYSFRIFPPANQLTGDQKLPGVTLPGGFTLIELPKPGADGAAPQSESVNNTNTARVDKAPALKDALCSFGHVAADSKANLLGVGTCTGAKDTCTGAKVLLSSRSVEPGSSHELMCDEKMPSDESDEVSCKQEDSNLDLPTEYSSSDTSDYCGEGDEDEEVVDIETVEEGRQGMAIAQLKEAVRKALQESRDSSDDFASSRELSIQDHRVDEHVEPESKRKRENHTWLERRRRSEQRVLFDKLQTVLQSDPRAPRLRLLSLALKEIHNLVETSRYLEEKKRRLMRLQSVYVKELSLLSGKSDTLIKQKLTQICDRQKTKESFLFSHLLQRRAADLQTATPQSKLRPTPLLQPDFFIAPSNPHSTADQNSVDLTPTPPSLPLPVSSPAPAELTAPSLLAENQPGDPGASAQDSVTKPQTECKPATPEVTAAQDRTSPVSSTPSSNSVQLSQRFTLPLIRSKTGRIILPSSLKPTGQGFYTLMVVNTKQKGQDGEASMQPSDVDSSKNQEKSFSKSDHPLDSEISLISEEGTTVQSSHSEPKGSGVTTPLAELALLNKSIFRPSVALLTAENSQEGGAVVSLNKTLAAASLSLNPVHQVPTHVEPEPDPSPPVVRRGRGRPRKNSVTPVSHSGKRTVVEDTSKSVISLRTEKKQSEKIASEVVKDTPGVVSDSLVPAKRARGRPRKNKSAQLCSPPGMRATRSSSKSNEDSPVRLYHRSKSRDVKLKGSPAANTLFRDVNTSRPLTRGALGKDFPSAKKRSWIDIEKELDPELESE